MNSNIIIDPKEMVKFGGVCECGGDLYYDRRTDDIFCGKCGGCDTPLNYFAWLDQTGREPLRCLYQDRIQAYFE